MLIRTNGRADLLDQVGEALRMGIDQSRWQRCFGTEWHDFGRAARGGGHQRQDQGPMACFGRKPDTHGYCPFHLWK
jgi:hypothetical protein